MATKKPPVTGYRQLSDKGRPTKSTPQKRPTSAMPGPRPKTSTRTSNTSQSKGGSLVKTGSNGMSSPVKPVSVRDVTPPPRGLPAGQTRPLSGSQQPSLPAGQTRALPPATSPKPGFASNLRRGAGVLSNAAMFYGIGSAIRQNSPLDSKNDSAARRADPRYQPMRQMSAAEMRNAPKLTQYNPDAPVRKTAAASKPASSSAPARSSSAPTVRNPTPQRTPAMVPQSKNMDENYTTWAKANKDLAEKVKPGQVGYDTIQKALGKTSSDTPAAKPTPKNGSSSGTEQAIRSIESDPKAKPFNTDKVPTKSETDKLKDLQALRIAKRKAGVA